MQTNKKTTVDLVALFYNLFGTHAFVMWVTFLAPASCTAVAKVALKFSILARA